jgi:hypothetical protein
MTEPQRVGLVDQVRRAYLPENRVAMAIGSVIGGWVPVASYVVAHLEARERPAMWVLVAGALLFSATSVYEATNAAFRSKLKAAGFTLLLEGAMVTSGVFALGLTALAILIGLNALAAGVSLALDDAEFFRARRPSPEAEKGCPSSGLREARR